MSADAATVAGAVRPPSHWTAYTSSRAARGAWQGKRRKLACRVAAPPIRAQPLGRARIWEEQGDAEGGGGGGQQIRRSTHSQSECGGGQQCAVEPSTALGLYTAGRVGFTALRALLLRGGSWLSVCFVQSTGLRIPRLGAFLAVIEPIGAL